MDRKALVVVLVLTAFTFLVGWRMEKVQKRKPLLITGIIGIVLLLVYFKYNYYLTGVLSTVSMFFHGLPYISWQNLAIPLGMSYLVFKYISYLVDVYWGTVRKASLIDFICYGSLFTIFSAGPIERFARLQIQLEQPSKTFDLSYLSQGFIRISIGLFKKLVLADWLNYFIDPVWQTPAQYHPVVIALAIAGYSLQIYFDFSGYSDIAIGSSKLLGLNIMENFNNPYLAQNIGDFWRRWHISLSEWIRDYLFVPLSRLSYIREWMIYLVPPISMSICGLWHGKELHFLLWGLWHGLSIDAYQFFRKTKSKLLKALLKSQLATFTGVTLAWIMFHVTPKTNGLQVWDFIIALVVLPLILFPLQKLFKWVSQARLVYNPQTASVLLILTLALQCLMNTSFIYANF